MNMTKMVFGTLLCVGGIACGLYVGLWWAFIGGIVDVINEVRAVDVSAMNIALGIVKVLFAGFLGWLAAVLMLIPGISLIKRA